MTARTSAIEAISTHEVAGNQEYLEHAGEAIYGEYVFDERVQREYLAKPVFKRLQRTIDGLEPFDPTLLCDCCRPPLRLDRLGAFGICHMKSERIGGGITLRLGLLL